MSTRGGIGYAAGDDGVRFAYQHYDSYPSELARTLLAEYHRLGGDLARMRKEAVDDHPGGWATYLDRCFCHDPDRNDEPDMVATCRCGAGDYTGCDALFIEWLYVLNSHGLDVYKSAPTGETQSLVGRAGNRYESPLYRHVFVQTLPWDADQLAVAVAEDRGHEVFETEWEEHGRETVA